jgi:hypothetical protein
LVLHRLPSSCDALLRNTMYRIETDTLTSPDTPNRGLLSSYSATVRPLIDEVNPLQTSHLGTPFRALRQGSRWKKWKYFSQKQSGASTLWLFLRLIHILAGDMVQRPYLQQICAQWIQIQPQRQGYRAHLSSERYS